MISFLLTFIFDRKKVAKKDKTGVVELKIVANRQRKYISTGIKLLPKEWKEGSVVGRKDWQELNDQLQSLKKRCSEIISRMIEDGQLDLAAIPTLLREGMMQQQTFLQYCRDCEKVRTRGLAVGTKKRYKVVLDFLEAWKGLTYFSDLTEKNIVKMDDYLAEKGLKENSRYTYHKILKAFIRMALEDGLIKKNPYARVKIGRGEDEGLQRCLTPEEFHRFETCVIPSDSLRKVRDLFVFQTYTLLSYSDLEDFDYKKCVKVEGNMIYKANRRKTGQEFTVVLLDPALAILKKYKNKLPIISNVKYNLYLKAAVKYAQIEKRVTTHWARHTGATMLINEEDIPMHIVQHILGHATIRETERTYAKVLDKTIISAMAKVGKKRKVG
jgi:integrase